MTASPSPSTPTWLDLYDWRTRVARVYRDRDAAHRAGEDPQAVLARFRAAKDALFASHPQSPLDASNRPAFTGLEYFAYDPSLRVAAILIPAEAEETVEAPSSGPHAMPMRRAATLDFAVAGEPVRLAVFWIDVYGGGLFVPFRDATCPAESYGAGRYLFDTVKGSDFERADASPADATGYAGGEVTLDFNYAYNPSCCYDIRWACPLAPRENWLTVPIRAGERNYDH
jgi:uncharacterized protein